MGRARRSRASGPAALPMGRENMRAIFLSALAGSAAGSVPRAAEAAGVNPYQPHRWAKKDEAFAKQMSEAKALGERIQLSLLEREADRRAVEGVEEPVYQKGELVGHIRRYSDLLLMFRTKKLDPSYREHPPDLQFNAGNVQVVVSSFAAPSPAPLAPSSAPALEEKNP